MTACIELQRFDTDAFGLPFYRIKTFDLIRLEAELAEMQALRPLIVDAKLRSDVIDDGAFLLRHGFRKVCTQIELEHPLRDAIDVPISAQIRQAVDMPPPVIRAHAAHFRFDRFSLDIALARDGHDRLYESWIRNSLGNGTHSIAVSGNNFVTYRDDDQQVRIDLVSVLDKGQGIGTDLIHALLRDARTRAKTRVKVVTECENMPAVRLYMKTGFMPSAFYSVYHLVRT